MTHITVEESKAPDAVAQRATWRPEDALTLGLNVADTVTIGIIGAGGAGKSHLGHQLLTHPDYGPEEVFFLMAEKSLTSYGVSGLHGVWAHSFASAQSRIEQFINAARGGKTLPKVMFVDSLSDIAAFEMQGFADDPILGEKSGKRDKISEYGALGERGDRFMLWARNKLPMDVIMVMRTSEGAFVDKPELAIAGKVIAKNFVGRTDVCLHLKQQQVQVEASMLKEVNGEVWYKDGANPSVRIDAPNVKFNRNEKGELDGLMVRRMFYAVNSGEVQAKEHKALQMIEPANLPAVLRKIHGFVP